MEQGISQQHPVSIMTKFKRTTFILLTLIICAWPTAEAQAISCAPLNAERLQSGMKQFPVIFIGEVVSVDYPNPDTVQNGIAHYRVARVFKGGVTEKFSMKASSWGDPFAGETYLMFIDSLENPSFDSPDFAAECRNSKVDQVDFDYMPLLGEGYEPKPGGGSMGAINMASQEMQSQNRMLQFGTIGAVSLLIIAVSYLLFRNSKEDSR